MDIERYRGQVVAIGGQQVKVVSLPDWGLNYIEYPVGESVKFRDAMIHAKIKIVRVTKSRIYFD